MPLRVFVFIGTLLGPLIVAALILTTKRAALLSKRENHELSAGNLPMAEGSLLERTICVETGQLLRSAIGNQINPIDRGCEVTETGGGNFEVESSFLIEDNATPVCYTVLITEGVIDEAEAVLDGKWEKIKIMVSVIFLYRSRRFPPLAEIDVQPTLGHRYSRV